MNEKFPEKRDRSAMLGQVEASPGEGDRKVIPLETDLQAQIGRQLRAIYDGVLNQPVPDRFLELLAELDRKDQPAADGSAAPAPPESAPRKDGD